MSSAAASRCPAFQNDYQYLPRGVKQDIQDQFGSNIRRGLPVLEFVNKVWGFDPSSIPKRPGGSQYTLNRSPLREYSDAIGPACIKPLVAILQDLLNQLFPGQSLLDEFTADNPQSRAVNARFINILDQPLLAVGEFQAFGPELGWGTPAGIQRQVWSWYLVYVGVTKTASIPMTLKADMNIPMGMFTEAQVRCVFQKCLMLLIRGFSVRDFGAGFTRPANDSFRRRDPRCATSHLYDARESSDLRLWVFDLRYEHHALVRRPHGCHLF